MSYRQDLDREDARLAGMAFDAILRNLGVIGEAVRDLPESYLAAHPGVPWHAIAGLRNVIVHEYFHIERSLIVDIVDDQLHVLQAVVQESRSD
jgi:uncharacterized protein with HEPN domain